MPRLGVTPHSVTQRAGKDLTHLLHLGVTLLCVTLCVLRSWLLRVDRAPLKMLKGVTTSIFPHPQSLSKGQEQGWWFFYLPKTPFLRKIILKISNEPNPKLHYNQFLKIPLFRVGKRKLLYILEGGWVASIKTLKTLNTPLDTSILPSFSQLCPHFTHYNLLTQEAFK